MSKKITGSTSDGYHTFDELYEYRRLYNAALFNTWAEQGLYDVHKSYYHSDGELPFGGGWFIVVAELPTGQVSNHYELKYWNLFKIPQKRIPNDYDGHSPKDVAERLHKFLTEEISLRCLFVWKWFPDPMGLTNGYHTYCTTHQKIVKQGVVPCAGNAIHLGGVNGGTISSPTEGRQ